MSNNDSNDNENKPVTREAQTRIVMPARFSNRPTGIQIVDRITSTDTVLGDVDMILSKEFESLRIKASHLGLTDQDVRRLGELSKILKTQEDIKMARLKSKEVQDELANLSVEELVNRLQEPKKS